MVCPDMVAGAKWLEDLGCDYIIISHIGYDERRGIAARGLRMPTHLISSAGGLSAVKVPVQAVGGIVAGTSDSVPGVRCTDGGVWSAADD